MIDSAIKWLRRSSQVTLSLGNFMRLALIIGCWLLSVATLQAQFKPYNPYADSNEDFIPVTPDGQVQWPTFFKDAGMQSKFKAMSEIGSCRGTNMRIVNMLENNKVDINKLPEATVTGSAQQLQGKTLLLQGKDQQSLQLVSHPMGVTKISVTGKMQLKHLKPGLFVRVATQVDDKGQGQETLKGLEVFTPDEKFKLTSPQGGKLENLAGVLKLVKDNQVQVEVNTPGKIRKLTLPVNADTIVHVNGSTLDLAGPNDQVSGKGRQYTLPNTKTTLIFASEITITKELPGAPKTVAASANESDSAK
jgi:hypothetical protein